jgi:thymidine phosphorylase
MNTPLGRSAGNWLEVKESVACLSGGGPADVRDIVVECAAQLLAETGKEPDESAARDRALAELESGRPLVRWNQMLEAQGADVARLAECLCADSLAPCVGEVRASRRGWVARFDARRVGEAVRELGGGRIVPGATVDARVGVDRMAKAGEYREKGAEVCRVHAADPAALARGMERMEEAVEWAEAPPVAVRLIQWME